MSQGCKEQLCPTIILARFNFKPRTINIVFGEKQVLLSFSYFMLHKNSVYKKKYLLFKLYKKLLLGYCAIEYTQAIPYTSPDSYDLDAFTYSRNVSSKNQRQLWKYQLSRFFMCLYWILISFMHRNGCINKKVFKKRGTLLSLCNWAHISFFIFRDILLRQLRLTLPSLVVSVTMEDVCLLERFLQIVT